MNGAAGGFGPGARERHLDRLAEERFDVCVIGGGIVGAGVALEAAARGLSVALLEREDFAAGSSGRSSKLVHGGLRYLARLDLGLCREAARERDALLRLAPYLVRPQPFLLPRRGRSLRLSGGLRLYDHLGGLTRSQRHRRLSTAELLAHAPALRPDRLDGGFAFLEATTDDARLVLAVLLAGHRRGAVVANHVEVQAVEPGRGGAVVEATDRRSGAPVRVRAGCVVNASGAAAAQVAGRAGGSFPPLRPSRGVHLVLPADRLPLGMAVVVPAPDGRDVFALPLEGVVVVGTTDVDHPPGDPATVTPSEAAYLLAALGDAFDVPLGTADVLAAWAGVRPLLSGRGRTADLSRRHAVTLGPGPLVSVAGGKLTTFRPMAARAVDAACAVLGRPSRPAPQVPLVAVDPGGGGGTLLRAARLGLDRATASHLLARHGERADRILDLVEREPDLGAPLAPGLSTIRAEAIWAARAEMAVTLTDVLDRRLRLALYDRAAGLGSAAPALVARELGWSPARLLAEIASYRAAVLRERGPTPLAGTGPGGGEDRRVVDREPAPA